MKLRSFMRPPRKGRDHVKYRAKLPRRGTALCPSAFSRVGPKTDIGVSGQPGRSVEVRVQWCKTDQFGSIAGCRRYWPLRLRANNRNRVDYNRSGSNAPERGKITRISANSPGSVSTSIEPPGCSTMMSRG